MAEDATDAAIADDELTEGLERKKISGKTIIIFGGAGLVVLLLIVAALVFLLSGGEEKKDPLIDEQLDAQALDEAERQQQAQLEADAPPERLELLFIDIGKKVYNLNTGGDGSSFLTVTIKLEVDRESYRADVEAKMPRILDEFNTYMRELRPADLEGAAGIFRLKEELLLRINQAVAPSRVKDILMQEFLIQGNS